MAATPQSQFTAPEASVLRAIVAEREPIGAAALALALRADQQQALDIEAAKATYWSLILDGAKLDVPAFTRLLSQLGRSVPAFEADMRAVALQRSTEKKLVDDKRQVDAALKRAEPAQAKLDAATAAIFGEDWQARLNSGEMVEAPYLTDLERGTVTTKVVALREPCADLEKQLAGIENVFTYQVIKAPSYLAEARAVFDIAVAAHVERQLAPAA